MPEENSILLLRQKQLTEILQAWNEMPQETQNKIDQSGDALN